MVDDHVEQVPPVQRPRQERPRLLREARTPAGHGGASRLVPAAP